MLECCLILASTQHFCDHFGAFFGQSESNQKLANENASINDLETQLSESQSMVGKLQNLNKALKERFSTFKKNEDEMMEHIDKLEKELKTRETNSLVLKNIN